MLTTVKIFDVDRLAEWRTIGRMAKDLTAVRIPGEMIDALRKISEQPAGFYSQRTASWLIVQAVKEFIERQQPGKHKKPQA